MNYEEIISDLQKRIEVLEKKEHKRTIKRRNKIIFNIIKYIIITTILVSTTLLVYNNYIKPYKEKIDYYGEKVDNVESYIKDKVNSFNNLFS